MFSRTLFSLLPRQIMRQAVGLQIGFGCREPRALPWAGIPPSQSHGGQGPGLRPADRSRTRLRLALAGQVGAAGENEDCGGAVLIRAFSRPKQPFAKVSSELSGFGFGQDFG